MDEHEPPETVLGDLREPAVADANGTGLRFGKSEDAVADGADDSTRCNAEAGRGAAAMSAGELV